ncbi:lysozyme [Leifsonia sp. NPDC058230]|uniref:lysozyme n=1 Tax=Leifsonia sp. NPDC058230 TaxID=3346391 RepID=UPI0036D86E07
MHSLPRLVLSSLSGFALVVGALTAAAPVVPSADPSDAATAAPTAPASPVPSSPAPSPTPTPSQAPTPSITPPAVSPDAPISGIPGDPSLETMNAAGNHSMGSTVAANDPAAVAPPSRFRSLAAAASPPGIPGLDVSGWQVLNASSWASIWANGARFAYVKATENTNYVSSQFNEQYTDSYNVGMLHGAYHFATPNTSNGAAQANWFLDHGGAGSADGRTMPPLLDIEYNPYGATCYGLNAAQMVGWIRDFSNTVQARIGRLPAIYSTTNWWIQCTGNSPAFSANPLFIARYPNNIADGAGTLPAGWPSYTLWQYASSGIFPGDQDVFNGNLTQLQTYGLGSSLVRTIANASVYLVSGTDKYPVTGLVSLGSLSPLGQIAYVPQAYLDQFTTRQAVGRVIRSPDGTIWYFDSGIKLSFGSCAMVEDFGGSCDPSGYVQLTAAQSAQYATGPAMLPLVTSSGGPRYDIKDGARHEVLDTASLTQAGLGQNTHFLSPTAVSYLPLGTPVVRDDVYASVAGTSTFALLTGGKVSAIDPSAAALLGLPGRAVGSLQAASIAQLPATNRFTGAFQAAGSSTIQVLGQGGLSPWAAGVGGAQFAPVTVPASFLTSYASKTPVAAGTAVMSTANGTVYLVMPNDIRPISSWDSLIALSGGKDPVITVVPQALISSLPNGPVALTAGTLVRSPNNATVYLVNGVTNKIAFSNFDYPASAGIDSFTFTTDDRLAAYPTSSSLLGYGVLCGSQKYLSAGGSIHVVSSAVSGLYPLSYVQLDDFTCTLLSKGVNATAFIRTPDGSIYYLNGGQKHPISSMARFAQLSAGQPYLDVSAMFAATYATGGPA